MFDYDKSIKTVFGTWKILTQKAIQILLDSAGILYVLIYRYTNLKKPSIPSFKLVILVLTQKLSVPNSSQL